MGCADTSTILTGKWAVEDTVIALQNMVIAAWAMGLGFCWIGDFSEDQVKQLLNVPNKWKIVALIFFGYPAEQIKSRKKKAINEIFSSNNFSQTSVLTA